ncbi:MAG: protoporphyrinogen oxidase [Halioglobus sp.]|jgi:protoporphyrinogen oxidase
MTTDAQTVVVAGAGIAGITAAFFAAQQGHRVILVEPASCAGGLLASDITEFGAFDRGTHVATFTGLDVLDDFLFGGVAEEDFNFFNPGVSGNYYRGRLSEISPFVDTSVLPEKLIARAEQELSNPAADAAPQNLEQLMVARFGPTIYREIFSSVVQKFMGCDAATLTPDTINLFDMNRILAFDAATSEQLKTQPRYNDALGYHGAHPGAQKLYPHIGGIGYWVEFIMKKLRDLGVTLLTDSSITRLHRQGDKVSAVEIDGEVCAVDQLIWSIAPALFAKLNASKIDFPAPLFRKTALYDYSFERPLTTNCYYINDYDTSNLASRITLYSNLTSVYDYHNCTVEVLGGDDFDFTGGQALVLQELRSSGLVEVDNPCHYQGSRPISNGFPVPDLNYASATVACSAALEKTVSNVRFVGRAPGRFFMKDVLMHTYEAVGGSRAGVV